MDTEHLPHKNTYQPLAHSQQYFTTASLIVLLMNSINTLCFWTHFLHQSLTPLSFLFVSYFLFAFSTLPLSFLPPSVPSSTSRR